MMMHSVIGRIVRQIPAYCSIIPKQLPIISIKKKFHVSSAEPPTQYLEIRDEKTGSMRKIAYVKSPGPRSPGIIYVPGFMSDKSGTKATSLYKFCQKYGFPYVRYDPSGLGESEGIKVNDVTISYWIEDAKEVLLRVTDGPQLVVASSMGGWIASLIAEKYPDKFASMLMIAPALNFHGRYEKILRSQLDKKSLQKYDEGGVVPLYSPDYGTFPLKKAQFEDMAKHELSLEKDSLDITCPIRIIHGVQDNDVPYKESLHLLNALKTSDLQLLYLKDGDHTMYDEDKLEIICNNILEMASPKSSNL